MTESKKVIVSSKQLLRSGSSIGANIKESIGEQSTADFISKIGISYKEAAETIYWIKLLEVTNYFTKEEAKNLSTDSDEIYKILSKIQIAIKQKRKS